MEHIKINIILMFQQNSRINSLTVLGHFGLYLRFSSLEEATTFMTSIISSIIGRKKNNKLSKMYNWFYKYLENNEWNNKNYLIIIYKGYNKQALLFRYPEFNNVFYNKKKTIACELKLKNSWTNSPNMRFCIYIWYYLLSRKKNRKTTFQ